MIITINDKDNSNNNEILTDYLRLTAQVFVDSLATFAEHQPDSRKIDFNGFTMQAMFEEGKQLHGEDFCSPATFYRLMDEDFPDVRLPGKSRFSVCDDVCTLLHKGITSSTGDQRKQYIELRHTHILQEMKERLHYHQKILGCLEEPTKGTIFIIDSMDQTKTAVPILNPKPKQLVPDIQLKSHLTGCKVRRSLNSLHDRYEHPF